MDTHHRNDSFANFLPNRSSTPVQQQQQQQQQNRHRQARQYAAEGGNKLRKVPSSNDLPATATLPLSFAASHSDPEPTPSQVRAQTPRGSNPDGSVHGRHPNHLYRRARDLLHISLSASPTSSPEHARSSSERDHLPDPFDPYGGSHHEPGLHTSQYGPGGERRDDRYDLDEYEFLHQRRPRRVGLDFVDPSSVHVRPREFGDHLTRSQGSLNHHPRSPLSATDHDHRNDTQTTPFLPLSTPYTLVVDRLDLTDEHRSTAFLPPSTSPVRSRPRSMTVSTLESSQTLPSDRANEVVAGSSQAKIAPLGPSNGKSELVLAEKRVAGDGIQADHITPNMRPAPSPPTSASPSRGPARAVGAHVDSQPITHPSATSHSALISPLSQANAGVNVAANDLKHGHGGRQTYITTSNRQSAPNGAPIQVPTQVQGGKGLHKPKSKLRLRLKLTPPYAPEEQVQDGGGGCSETASISGLDTKARDERSADMPRALSGSQQRIENGHVKGHPANMIMATTGKKAQAQGLGLGRPDSGESNGKYDQASERDVENRPPAQGSGHQTGPQPANGHVAGRQSSAHAFGVGHARTPSTNAIASKLQPNGIGLGLGLGGIGAGAGNGFAHAGRQASYGNTYPVNGDGGGAVRGHQPGHASTDGRNVTGNRRREHLDQHQTAQAHIAVQRPALTSQTFEGPARSNINHARSASYGQFGQVFEYDRRHAVADSHVPNLYEPALGVGIHEAPSPEAIGRAQHGGPYTPGGGTVDSRTSTITPYNFATITHRTSAISSSGGERPAGHHAREESGRYLSPYATAGHPTSTLLGSRESQEGGNKADRLDSNKSSDMSSVNLSFTLSRGNSAISFAPKSPSSVLTSERPNVGVAATSPGRAGDLFPARPLATRLSRENISLSGREATPSSFGNVDASFESGLMRNPATKPEDGEEELAETQQGNDIGLDVSDARAVMAYACDAEPTLYPNDSAAPEVSGVSSPFSQDKYGAAASDSSRVEACSTSEKTRSSAMTEERNGGEITSSEGNTTVDSAGSGATNNASEGSSNVKPHNGVTDIFTITDQQLSDRYKFVSELGFGNWGSVWLVKPRTADAHPMYRHKVQVGAASLHPSIAAQHHPQKLAIKLVHRTKTPTTAARVRALWSEMKIVRTLREAPHPSIIGFDSFVITPSYALIIMPCLGELIPVNLKSEKAKGYFRQLASAVAYLHENRITHNDIKPSNIIISYANVPVLVDFGFAQKWDMNGPSKPSSATLNAKTQGSDGSQAYTPYWSEIAWGTPEYLSPQRAKGQYHDERLSDVWALGITFFEILCGRTPFEVSEEEDFSTPEQLAVYFDRTVSGAWVGEWTMKSDMEAMLHQMILPDVALRITAAQAANSNVLHANTSAAISTPPFVRDAAAYSTHRVAKKRKSVKAEAMVKPSAQGRISAQSLEKVEAKAPARSDTSALRGRPQPKSSKLDTKQATQADSAHGARMENVATKSQYTSTTTQAQRTSTVVSSAQPVNTIVSCLDKHVPTEALKTAKLIDQASPPALTKVVRRIPDFDNGGREVSRQRSFDQDRKSVHLEGSREALVMRRPASALALRSVNELDQLRTQDDVRLGEGQHRVIDRSNTREKNRHARVQSDSKVLGTPALSNWPVQTESAAGAAKLVDKWVHFAPPGNPSTTLPHGAAVRGEEGIYRPVSSVTAVAAPEALQRLDRIAGWIKDVEKIVATAREALEEAQVESRNSQAISQGEQAEILETIEAGDGDVTHKAGPLTSEPKIRHSRTASAFSTFAEPATPTGWTRPSFDLDEWKPTHLRRQRSDLTGMNVKSSFKPVASVAVDHMKLQPGDGHDFALDGRKLRSHKSAGDLGKLMQRNDDPYDALLTSQPGVARIGDGWSSTAAKAANNKSKPGFAKKDHGFKGWLTSVKARFGKKA